MGVRGAGRAADGLAPRRRRVGHPLAPARAASGFAFATSVALALAAGPQGARAATSTSVPAADPLTELRDDGAIIDWREGMVRASGGAAADLRMPSAVSARGRAERTARQAALRRLASLLGALPLTRGHHLDAPAVARALGRARVLRVEYQSNGGAVVEVGARFGDWAQEEPAAPVGGKSRRSEGLVLTMPLCHLQAAPTLVTPLRAGAAAVVGEGSKQEGQPQAKGPQAAGQASQRQSPAPRPTSPARSPLAVSAARYRTDAPPRGDTSAVPAHLDDEGRVVLDGALPAEGSSVARDVLIYCRQIRSEVRPEVGPDR